MTDHEELARLTLRIRRGLLAQDQFRTLLTAATATVARNRRDLQELKARIARRSHRAGRTR